MPVRVGVIGCGRIAQLAHLKALASTPGARVIGLADLDAARLQEARRRMPGVATFATGADLLRGSEADAVLIALPPALHAESAIAAFEAGRHVYLEKPIATTLPDAQAVVRAWRRSGRVGMIGFNYRFHPLHQASRACVADGRVGEVVAVSTTFSSAARELPAWKMARHTGGGALMELASHHLDLVRFVLGQPVVEVSAMARSQHSEADTISLQLRLMDGLLVQSLCSINTVAEDRFEIYGRKGKLSVDRYAGTLTLSPPRLADGRLPRFGRELRRFAGGLKRVLRPPGEISHGLALAAFAAAVRSGQQATPDLEDGYHSLALVTAAEAAIDSGRTVVVAADDVTAPA